MKNLLIKSSAAIFLATLFLFANGIVATTRAEPVYAPDLQAGPEYDFRKAKWGMSAEEVKATENMKGISQSRGQGYASIIYSEIGFFEILCSLAYTFDNDHLISGQYFFVQPIDAYQELIRICEKHYGPYKSVLQDKSDGAIILLWDLGGAKMDLTSYTSLTEGGNYEYQLAFYYPEIIDHSFAEPVSFEDYNPIFQAGPQYNFRKARWLMTMDEVIASEDAAPAEEGLIDESGFKGKYLAYPKVSVFGYPAMPGYTFADEKLIIGSYFIKSEEDATEDILKKCEAQFGAHKYYTDATPLGEKQYTWDLGKTILAYNIAPYSSEQKERSYRLTFYYRKQIKEIPPN